MIDLVCLVADRSIEAAIDGVLRRPEALGIRAISFETIVHPHRDPGCFHAAGTLLAGYVDQARHALVLLDRQWAGAPAGTGADLERLLEASLGAVAEAEWAQAIVIDPELEVWAFSDSPHVATTLAGGGSADAMRRALVEAGLWVEGESKPRDPKEAVRWLLRRSRQPLSSSIFRDLAGTVGFGRCSDRSFLRLKDLLQRWFGGGRAAV